MGVEDKAHPALHAVRAVCGHRGWSAGTRGQTQRPCSRCQGPHLHRCQFPSRRQQRTSPPQTSPRCPRAQGRGIAPAAAAGWRPPGWGGTHWLGARCPAPPPQPPPPARRRCPHLVAGQALQQDLLGVPASLQCDEVHAMQPQPLPGLPCQAPHAGLGGVPEPVPGKARVRGALQARGRGEGAEAVGALTRRSV